MEPGFAYFDQKTAELVGFRKDFFFKRHEFPFVNFASSVICNLKVILLFVYSYRDRPIRTELPFRELGGVKIFGLAVVRRFDHFPCKLLKSKTTSVFPVL